MIDSFTLPRHLSRALLSTMLVALVAVLAVPGSTLAATNNVPARKNVTEKNNVPATKTVRYHGISLTVPAIWPVFHLGADSTVCVRFNRHAVYLGTPGTDQLCPVQAVGRTEAILVSPDTAGNTVDGRDGLAPVSNAGAASPGGSMARFVERADHVVITATWNHDPREIMAALDVRSLAAATRATNGHRPAPASTAFSGAARQAHLVSPTSPATPGEVYAGLGFDTCEAPSESAMSDWLGASPEGVTETYGAVGVYIGGADAACLGGNLNSSWVSAESAAGWHLIPTYVGLQAPGNSCGCSSMSTTATVAMTQGTAAAQDAVTQAQALGIGTGNPIYFDMEAYTPSATVTPVVLAFLQAWTEQLHSSGYLSGVYSSSSSGIADLVSQAGTGYVEPDDIWIAQWTDPDWTLAEPGTGSPAVPSAEWENSQRVLQYGGAHDETHPSVGGIEINVDADYVDGATAAAGNAAAVAEIASAPTLTIKPQTNGDIDLTPAWDGEPGVSQYQILAGDSQTALTPLETFPVTESLPIVVKDVYSYYEVQALNATGGVLGTSAPTATPASVAIFGNSAFVPSSGTGGVPVACLNAPSCHVEAAIYEGRKRLTHTAVETIPRSGGIVRFALNPHQHKLVSAAANHRFPVTVTVTTSTGVKATQPLNLVPYAVSGKTPERETGSSTTVTILGKTDFVSNGWTGAILVACTATTPCQATTRVTTRSGALIATEKTQALGSGEIGYLGFDLTARGHALLKSTAGNQLAVRVSVKTAQATPQTGGTSPVASAATASATALLSLSSYR